MPPVSFKLPRIIALCGNPKSGKSLVQEILLEEFGHQPVDDGHPLRAFAVEHLGLSWDDVRTQEGKERFTEILGKDWQNRKLLGELGKSMEALLGHFAMPFMATRSLDPNKRYSFGSVRRDQGLFYQAIGGVVIEIVNPLAHPTGNDFDTYEPGPVVWRIRNNGLQKFDGDRTLALDDLRAKVKDAVNALTTVVR